ncbi:aldo/keto reductase, diketogulonate reductase [Salinarchaeum sp. Harcht-Bsk1]|uniref:aldo/keto reductase n=1 Tax=Salinarchaeum sp. Harcht-Bsk1 TaxID=1333523 RepID=UPI0003422810|nr:aldo/keto reductase [Salinarchaeum sp. Harcht-Bsk1]AGN00358.1 aldo/keto reductase, diketogulonate reductase [Salinarchaeum sp. Harcht-Bsk1]
MDFPRLGLGTMGIDDPDAVTTAIDLGYRHLDTAQIYDNEAVVGEGIDQAGVDRDDLLVATKLWIDQLDRVRESTVESLDRLGLDSVDLLYVHRPKGAYDPESTLSAMAELRDDGLIDGIAVSNFEIGDLDRFADVLGEPPAANQVEYHPLFQPEDRLEHAREHDYPLVAYSPLSGGEVDTVEPIVEVADRHGITPEQASLAWLLAKGIHPIPKASSREHLEANRAALDVELTDEDVAAIDAVEREHELYPE